MKTLLIAAVLGATVLAQEAEAPKIDPDLMAAWKTSVAFAQATLKAQADALAKTPEYKAAKDAEQKFNQLKAQIQQTASKKAPGYVLDMEKWTLSPQK
jgi:hypothetical protein